MFAHPEGENALRKARKGTNGVSTNGATAIFMFSNLAKQNITFSATPVMSTLFVRNQKALYGSRAAPAPDLGQGVRRQEDGS